MTYNASEASVQDGDPIYRFQFVQGTTYYRYTSAPFFSVGGDISSNDEVDSSGQAEILWEPIAISPVAISQTGEMEKDTISITIPRDNSFALLFLDGTPEEQVSVTIFRGHVGDTSQEFRTYWKGRVASSSTSLDAVSIECENVFTSLRRAGLRARYQKTCRHALYRRGCGLNQDDYAVGATCTAASGFTITVNEAALQADGYYTGGMIKTDDGILRYITGHSGQILTLSRPVSSLSESVSSSAAESYITIYPGCDHTRTTCVSKFDNVVNFGGFPWIPRKNPFGNNVTGSIS